MRTFPSLLRPLQNLTAAAVVATAIGASTLVVVDARPASADAPDTLAELLIAASGGGALDNSSLDYDILLQTVIALEALGGDPDLGGATLLEVLSNPEASITVFAPRDLAFRRLARDLGWNGSGGDGGALTTIVGAFDLATIRNVVKYHVVPGRYSVLKVLRTKTFHTALPGTSFKRVGLTLKDNEPDLRDPQLTLPLELRGGKGTAHTITRVLIPVDL
ncbi:MAG: fasciclin domain-containing protein [Candidatus Binatia bacterium]